MFVQVIVQRFLYKVVNKSAHGWSIGADTLRSEFGFRLRFNNRFLHFDGNGPNYGSPDIRCIKFLFIELTYGFHDSLSEGSLMRAAWRSMLPIYERVILFSILLPMCQRDLNILSL